MSELVKLVNEWDSFEKEHPQSSIEDFCRYYLVHKRAQAKREEDFLQGRTPPDSNGSLAKVMGRIAGIMNVYLKTAYRDEKNMDLEWAYFLNAIYLRGEARKTDVIHFNFYEQSTGIDILNRLRQAGLITEREDPDDKRARLVKITPKGEAVVIDFWEKANKNAAIMFGSLNEDDKRLMIQLLSPLEIRHTNLLPEVRNKSLDEIMVLHLGAEQAGEIKATLDKRFAALRSKKKTGQH